MNAGEQLLSALGDGKPDPMALVKQQAMMKVSALRLCRVPTHQSCVTIT
jgi:hypothetical protein